MNFSLSFILGKISPLVDKISGRAIAGGRLKRIPVADMGARIELLKATAFETGPQALKAIGNDGPPEVGVQSGAGVEPGDAGEMLLLLWGWAEARDQAFMKGY